MSSTSSLWTPPENFGEYRLVSLIGRGGMGEVYLGHDELLDRLVAIKFIRGLQADSELHDNLLNEARAAARLQHPNVPTIHRVGEIEGHPFIISEYIRGRSLDRVPKPMPWRQALKVSIGLCRALAAAHRHNVLHRDIKPGNAILTDDDEIKLLDFGLAKLLDAAARSVGVPPKISVGMAHSQRIAQVSFGQVTQTAAAPVPQPLSETQEWSAPTQGAITPAPSSVNVEITPLPTEKLPQVRLSAVPDRIHDMVSAPTMALDIHPRVVEEINTDKFPIRPTPMGTIKGTPVYMAPELWQGKPASRRSDVYSMGALMYELCSGDPPYATLQIEDLPLVVTEQDVPPLAQVVADVDPQLAAIIDRCLRRDPSARYASGEELRVALEALNDGIHTAALPEGNPYRGLFAFEAEHRTLFFGRDNEIGTVLERLRSELFVLVAADSGLGKSSLCRAGVLPRIEEGALGGGRRWEAVTVLPGRHPAQTLAAALVPILRESAAAITELLMRQPVTLGAALEKSLGGERGLVLFIDQMEELISLSTEEEAAAVALAIGRLTDGQRAVRVLGTARSDFLARLTTLPMLGDELARALYLLRPLSRDKLRDVIVGPAQAKGVHFESDGLVETLIDATVNTDGGLPLLQFALAELWDAHKQNAITAMALAEIGGVAGALARHADHVLLSLPPDQRLAARHILIQLVTAEGTRARGREAELLTEAGSLPALNALLHGRLLIVRHGEEGTVYEVAHEALIKGWSMLRGWIGEQAESRAVKQSLQRATANWLRLGKAPEALWGQRQLAEVTNLQLDGLTPGEEEFIATGRGQVRQSRLLRRFLIGLLPVTLLFIYAGVQIKLRYDLNKRVMLLTGQGRAALQKAHTASYAAELRRDLAFLDFDLGRAEQGEKEWTQAHALEVEANRSYARSSQILESALAVDPGRLELRALIGEVLYERAVIASRERAQGQLDDLTQRITLYDPSGRLQQRLNAPARLRISSNPSGAAVTLARYSESSGLRELTATQELGTTPLREFEFEPGSYLLTLRALGRREVRYPVRLGRADHLEINVALPDEHAVPPGFVYIPEGRFLVGTSTDDTLRQSFLFTVPIHPVTTRAYLIAQHETTYAEWIDYLTALRAGTRTHQELKVGKAGLVGGLTLSRHHGSWSLSLQLATQVYNVQEGEPLVYRGRKVHAEQNWLRLPVSGISREESMAYAAWLDRSGRLPGARLCNDYEWERAARGADEREFPNGDELTPADANFDATYSKEVSLMGPDEVGLYPRSRSPFGVDDMAGNVFEWTTSSLDVQQVVARGGGFTFGAFTCRSTNRTLLSAGFRDPGLGVRICAAWPLRPGK